MATKKKTSKPVKKSSPPKKKTAVKKAPAKHGSPSGHKNSKSAGKKAAHADSKKPVAKKASKPIAKPQIKKANHKAHPPLKPLKKNEIAKTIAAVKEDRKVELKKPDNNNSKASHVSLPQAKKPTAAPKPVKVVIPEIKTKTARKYEPEFTKSVLDQPENMQTGPTMRYSDTELTEFRELIQKKLDQAKKELAYLQGLITRKDEMGGDETENRYMTMEDGSMSMEREQLAQMASRQINYIDHLEKAMVRIENKTYGICRITGKLIDKARLRAVPHATLSIEAKQMMNK